MKQRPTNRREIELGEFAERIRDAIEALGMSQAGFGRSVGITTTDRSRVGKWLAAQAYPDVSMLLEIERVHGLTVEWMLTGNATRLSPGLRDKLEMVKSKRLTK